MRGRNILKELNSLARDVGAPVDGTNISEQVAALKGHMASDTIPYSKVTDKPKINNVTVDGNLSWEDLGLAAILNHFTFSANSKTYYLQPEQPSNPQDGDIWIG